MATPTLEEALRRLRDRARQDDAVAEAVTFLADDLEDPYARPSASVMRAARELNSRRQHQRLHDFLQVSLDTAEVVDLIGSISDRKAVDRRRARGSLLGVRIGNTVMHPRWQFDRRRGDTREGLGQVIDALRRISRDALEADYLMTAPREDLGGRTIADVFAEGNVELAVRLIRMAGDQS